MNVEEGVWKKFNEWRKEKRGVECGEIVKGRWIAELERHVAIGWQPVGTADARKIRGFSKREENVEKIWKFWGVMEAIKMF